MSLRDLILEHHGNRSAIARATGSSPSTVARHVREQGLAALADEAAAAVRRSGPRCAVSDETAGKEREAIIDAIATHGAVRAAKALGIPLATVYRRRAAYGIEAWEIIERARYQ